MPARGMQRNGVLGKERRCQALAGLFMFRFLFRFAALVVIAVSFLFVVYDGTKSIADQTIYISRVGPT